MENIKLQLCTFLFTYSEYNEKLIISEYIILTLSFFVVRYVLHCIGWTIAKYLSIQIKVKINIEAERKQSKTQLIYFHSIKVTR